MINNEKVTIELKNKNLNNPPIKFCKAKNGKPSNKNFVFRANAFHQITEYVQNINWSSVEKTVDVQVTETPRCDVYQWMNYLNQISNTLQNKPYSDLDANNIMITVQDESEKDIADLRLRNVKVIYHECIFDKNNENVSDLCHLITLSYEFEEFVLRQSLKDNQEPNVQETDDEWQTIETP